MRRMDEKGVSPVIGVILMVAITVILAAVIASFVFGMGSSVKKTYTVAATASKTCSGGSCTVYITYQGGPDADAVTALNFTADGCKLSTEAQDGVSNPTVGTTWNCTDANSNKTNHIVVAATFSDGSKQVILDTFV